MLVNARLAQLPVGKAKAVVSISPKATMWDAFELMRKEVRMLPKSSPTDCFRTVVFDDYSWIFLPEP